MRKFLLAGLFLAATGAARAEEGRYQVIAGSMPGGTLEAGKVVGPSPVVIKLDTVTGDSWRLVISNGYWWVPMKNGVIASKKAPEEKVAPAEATGEEEPAPAQ